LPYILAFWCDADGEPRDPNVVFDRLCDSATVDGLAALPIADINSRFQSIFDTILSRSDDVAWEGGDDMFLLETGNQHVFLVAGHSTNTDHYNTAIDIMKEFGCPLYDPQTETRNSLK
jgi:hypothetical protein